MGAGLTFEKASNQSQISLENIRNITTFDNIVSSLLSTSRRALFGNIETFYLDLERQNDLSDDTVSIKYAHKLKDLYPFLTVKSSQMILAELRMVKSEAEVNQIIEAIKITEKGLNRIMNNLKPGINEAEAEAEFKYVLNKHKTTTAFDTIAAGGKNATILHYVDNQSMILDRDLVLFDLGVSYENYNSDITRVYPANGTFTDRQKAVYEVVLEANKKTIEWIKPGVTLKEFNEYGKKILVEGAKKLGLITEDDEITKYYYHGLGHYLGLDVHDVGNYSLPIPEGAIITIEPGLYIAEEGIGIRIEDDIYVSKNGSINLSKGIIKEIDEIEAFMKK